MTSYLRPDEESSQSIVRSANEKEKNIKRGLKTAVGIGTTAVGSGLSSKILPFLSEYIPSDLALKGISKISPKIGDFLKSGLKSGLDLEGGLDYLKKQFNENEESAQEKRNIIEQYSPELHQFIDQEIKKGRTVIEAGAIAQQDKRFKDVISKLSKDHKSPWSNILESVYGSQQKAQPEQQQQQGKGQAALMAILEKLQKSRGGQ
jgi:hypothetical protein